MPTPPAQTGGDGRSLRPALVRPSHPGSNRLDTRLASRVLATVVLDVPTRRALADQNGLLAQPPTIAVPEDRLIRIGEPVGVHIMLEREQLSIQGRGVVRQHRRLPAHRYQTAITIELGGDEGDFPSVVQRLAAGDDLTLTARDRRFQVRLPAKVSREGERATAALVRDFSRTGMRLEVDEPPEVGTSLRVRLRPPGAHAFEMMTRVERVALDGVGVRLLHISPRASAALNALYARISVLASLALS